MRADTAGCTKVFPTHLRDQRDKAVGWEFSVGWAITDRERTAIGMVPKTVWADADADADAGHRDGAGRAELTGLPPAASLEGYPGTRVIVGRERPHPGAQLDLMDTRDGWRYTCSPPTSPPGDSPSSTPATAPTPGSRTASGPGRAPA